ncbi:AMP-binding enzyme family protein [Burkholderia pseudomallei]|nr:AMP-binding enzyme family protein [Burkholderia pseudomallei]KGV11515.1 AMP-binding enzyme family protein [Burkholderia pseudomallei TSV 43]KGV41323.1 AMP-binding enzyme family protein [Burkholderia pseudomallei TSV 31]
MAADSGMGALIAPMHGLSYVRGPADVPLSDATIGQFLLDTVARFPDRVAVVFREQGVRWTWREFADEVDALAAALIELGIARGDRSASGRRTAPNGCSRNLQPRVSARCSSTSIPPIGWPSSNTR